MMSINNIVLIMLCNNMYYNDYISHNDMYVYYIDYNYVIKCIFGLCNIMTKCYVMTYINDYYIT